MIAGRNKTNSDLFRLTHCPQCLYNLTGLQAKGRCPECGFAYNDRMMLIPAWLKNTGPWPQWTTSWLLAPAALVVLFGVLSVLGIMPRLALLYAVIMLAFFGIAIPAMIRARRMSRGIGDIDLFFDDHGLTERRSRGLKGRQSWRRFKSATIKRIRRRPAHVRPQRIRQWYLDLNLRWPTKMVRESPRFVIQCTKRQAALLRSEINRRIRVASDQASRSNNS